MPHSRYSPFNLAAFNARLDHGLLLGRTDDDHVGYLLITGTRAMTGGLLFDDDAGTIGSNTINDLLTLGAAGLTINGTLGAGATTVDSLICTNGATFDTNTLVVDAVNHLLNGTNLTGDNTNFNLFLGTGAFNNDGGEYNIGIGYEAGYNNDTTGSAAAGDKNVYIGFRTGYGATAATNNTGYYNTGIGYQALYNNTDGNNNFALGYRALFNNEGGDANIGIGASSLIDNIGGNQNIAIGGSALQENKGGRNNIAIGHLTSQLNVTGIGNIAIGSSALKNATSGNYNIVIGYFAGLNQTTPSNLLIIDNQDRGSAANEIIYPILYGVMNAANVDDPTLQSLRVNASLILAQSGTATDAATFTTGADGDLTITTVDADGTAGDITLSPDGVVNITQDTKWSDGKFLIVDKASGNGIKVDTTAPTFGFADIIGDQFSKNTGATKPTLTAYNGAVDAWQFSDSDEAYLTYHLPHDYVPGTDIYLHVHWSQTSATATGGTIDFKYFAVYAKGWNQATGSTFTATPKTVTFASININDAASGLSQYQHHLTEIIISAATATAALFDRDDFEPDGVIELTLEMDANNLTNSGAVLDPFIHYADLHYQTTGIMGTKSQEPDFYA